MHIQKNCGNSLFSAHAEKNVVIFHSHVNNATRYIYVGTPSDEITGIESGMNTDRYLAIVVNRNILISYDTCINRPISSHKCNKDQEFVKIDVTDDGVMLIVRRDEKHKVYLAEKTDIHTGVNSRELEIQMHRNGYDTINIDIDREKNIFFYIRGEFSKIIKYGAEYHSEQMWIFPEQIDHLCIAANNTFCSYNQETNRYTVYRHSKFHGIFGSAFASTRQTSFPFHFLTSDGKNFVEMIEDEKVDFASLDVYKLCNYGEWERTSVPIANCDHLVAIGLNDNGSIALFKNSHIDIIDMQGKVTCTIEYNNHKYTKENFFAIGGDFYVSLLYGETGQHGKLDEEHDADLIKIIGDIENV